EGLGLDAPLLLLVDRSSRLERMQSSEEIRRVVERWMAGISSADAESVLERLSEHPSTLLIGTDPNEWWQGEEVRVFGRQIEEMTPHPITWEKIDAWGADSYAWG